MKISQNTPKIPCFLHKHFYDGNLNFIFLAFYREAALLQWSPALLAQQLDMLQPWSSTGCEFISLIKDSIKMNCIIIKEMNMACQNCIASSDDRKHSNNFKFLVTPQFTRGPMRLQHHQTEKRELKSNIRQCGIKIIF